jgi:hypothetical protein
MFKSLVGVGLIGGAAKVAGVALAPTAIMAAAVPGSMLVIAGVLLAEPLSKAATEAVDAIKGLVKTETSEAPSETPAK